MNWYDRIMLAVTFAEAGMPETGVALMEGCGREGSTAAPEGEDCLLAGLEAQVKVVKA